MMNTAKKTNVLYIDDDDINLSAFRATLRRQFNVYTASSAFEGRKVLEIIEIDIIISDYLMPEMRGIDFLRSIRKDFPKPIRILLTGFADSTLVSEALNNGDIQSSIYKPWDSDVLISTINEALRVGGKY